MYAKKRAVPLKKKPCNDENQCIASTSNVCELCTLHSFYSTHIDARPYVNNTKEFERLCNVQIKQMIYAVTIDRMVTIWIGGCLCHSSFQQFVFFYLTGTTCIPLLRKHVVKRQQKYRNNNVYVLICHNVQSHSHLQNDFRACVYEGQILHGGLCERKCVS